MHFNLLAKFFVSLLAFFQVPGQTPVGIFGSGAAAGCGTPVATNLKVWVSADCMTAISPCATSYSDGHSFTTNQTWLDRSGNANNLTIDANELACVFKLNKLNGLPAMSFSGPDGSGACGWTFASQPDSGATSWAVFVVFQAAVTGGSGGGVILGPHTAAAISNTFMYVAPDTFAECAAGASRQQSLVKSGAVLVSCGNASPDLNWHQMSVQFSNSTDQNTNSYRIDKGSDGPASFTSSVIGTSNGGIGELGVRDQGSSYSIALQGRIAELLIYTGTGALLTGGNVTTNETYLGCRYGL